MDNAMENRSGAGKLDRLDRLLQGLTRRVCLFAGWGLIALSAVITINVVLRKLFNYSLQGVDEYGGYCLAVCAAIGFSQAAFERGHIRIDLVTRLVPQRARAVFDVIALLALNFTAWTIGVKAFGVFQTSYQMGALATSALRTHLSIPQGVWVGALLWFCFILLLQLVRAVIYLLQRDWQRIEREFGTPDTQTEVEQEMEQTRVRLQGKQINAQGAL
jgi:TRAP-type C4-dicarboxylate transport system permease small subunit